MKDKKIGIIGCGNMGTALISGLASIRRKTKFTLVASDIDSSKKELIKKRYKIKVADDNKKLTGSSDVVILAVKPKDFDGLLEDISGSLSDKKILISIAAGVRAKYIEGLIPGKIPVVRVMPNMPAVIGEAISSISAGSFAKKADVKLAKSIFSSIGDVIEVDENLVDAVTAISGSGPAYFFYLVESMIEAARELGLNERGAKSLVYKTALGSSKLLGVLKGEPAEFRAKVTSKGGTTEAAISIFESKNFKDIVKEAIKEACRRSEELSRG